MRNQVRAHAAVGEIHQVKSGCARGKGEVGDADKIPVADAVVMLLESIQRAPQQTGVDLAVAAVLFAIGALGVLVRRNVLVMFMCVELMLNAANLSFVTFARELNDIGGQVLVFFVLVVAAAEVVVGLGIVVTNFRRRSTTVADDLNSLKG